MDVVITYETLFDLLRKEKGREELQELPEDFYAHMHLYLRQQREAADAGTKGQIQYRNVQKILRELYERRERKIIEMALNRARTESNLIDTGALLSQELIFFEEVAQLLKKQKQELLETLIAGDRPAGVEMVTAPVEPPMATPSESLPEKCGIKFLSPVPKFLGLQGQIHGPFETGEETTLPGKIAALLVKKKRAEML